MAKYFDKTLFPDEESTGKMTPEMLRRYPGFENYNDEQAVEMIKTIEKFTNILHDIHIQQSPLMDGQNAG
jgi:hypothetical protein